MASPHHDRVLAATADRKDGGSARANVDLIDLGPRRLRDLPTAVRVSQVRAAGLRTDFPPLRALDVTPEPANPDCSKRVARLLVQPLEAV